MKTKLRKEEYTAMGDFILPSFVRDQAEIESKFPKFNAAFLTAFTNKLEFVKHLESSLVVTDEQKKVTKGLYETAGVLNAELTVLNSYINDADLNPATVTAVKNDIFAHNIEGAVLKLEAVIQFIQLNQAELEAEGMPHDFRSILMDYKEQLEAKNTIQNNFMNRIRTLVETNRQHYDELYGYIAKIANKGKLVFKDSVVRDEYTVSKIQKRMRNAKFKGEDKGTA